MVCHLSVTPPPLARSMHMSCIGKLHVCFDLHSWLLPLHMFFSWILQCVFYNFAWVLPSFLHILPRLNGLERGVCHLSAPPICKMYAPVLCGKLHVCVDLYFWLALLHFSWFFLGSWSPPLCFLQFCMVLPSFLHSLPRLNGLERGVCHLSVPHLQDVYIYIYSYLCIFAFRRLV